MKEIINTLLIVLTALRDNKLDTTTAVCSTCNIKVKRLKNKTIRIDMIPV